MPAEENETQDLKLLSTGAVLADPAKDLIVATGADRSRFLHGILTGNVEGTPVGGGCHAALLTLKAHVVAELRIFVRDDSLYLLVPVGEGIAAAAALSRYAIMDDFTAAPRADFSVTGILGPGAEARLAQVGVPVGELAHGALWSHADVPTQAGALWLARARQLGADGFWIAGAAAEIERLTESLRAVGVRRLASEVAEAARIAAAEPAWGREITSDYFPMEVGLDDAIDYTKGCFLGQEPIVRIRDRGHVNWRLARLDLTDPVAGDTGGAVLPSPGDRLETDAKPKAGKITSVARLPDGGGVALGLVHVSVGSGQQVRIPSTDGRSVVATVVG